MAGELILIVEDDSRSAKLAREILEIYGYRTVEARTVEAALTLAFEEHPDLVLMDIQLPDGDGVDVLRRLRLNKVLAAIPVIAVTAFAMREDEQRLRDSGFDGYVSKPVSVKTLAGEVQRQLAARSSPPGGEQ